MLSLFKNPWTYADAPGMEFVHHCTYCGWRTPAATVSIAGDARCAECGCGLTSSRASEAPAPAPVGPPAPRLESAATAKIGGALLCVAVVSAGLAGAAEGGPAIGLVTAGLALLAGSGLAFQKPAQQADHFFGRDVGLQDLTPRR